MATHILLVTFPGQGDINPALQLGKCLTKLGVKITIMTSRSAVSRMDQTNQAVIDFTSFSDGYDKGWSIDEKFEDFMSSLENHGSKAVTDLIIARREEGRPFSRIIHTLLVPWVGKVAHALQVPATLLWIQPATVFDIYFYYFNGYFRDSIEKKDVIQLPGLPTLEPNDLPSYLLPSSSNLHKFALPIFRKNYEMLDTETIPTVLVNTFDELEPEPLRVVKKYKLVAIGPLIPSMFLDGSEQFDNGGDLIKKTVEYKEWMDSQQKSSIIYISFGSYCEVPKSQLAEIAQGLLKSNRPFLWVIRESENSEKLDEIVCYRDDLEKLGKIVPWCTQVEVLSHPSVGCFVTHCGWNSSLEGLALGVPVVGVPQWTDQTTNAKLMQDFWKTGMRARKGESGGIVQADEIKRCIEIVMDGERGYEMRKEAKKWKDLARKATMEDGTSNVNLKLFSENIVGQHSG